MVKTIHDTFIVPYILAERVIHDYMKDNKIALPYAKIESLTTFLVKKSERIFECNDTWRIGLIKAKDSREYLCSFMAHWLHSEMNTRFVPLVQVDMFQINSQLNLFK